jgi:hypothetical protein
VSVLRNELWLMTEVSFRGDISVSTSMDNFGFMAASFGIFVTECRRQYELGENYEDDGGSM